MPSKNDSINLYKTYLIYLQTKLHLHPLHIFSWNIANGVTNFLFRELQAYPDKHTQNVGVNIYTIFDVYLHRKTQFHHRYLSEDTPKMVMPTCYS